MGNNKRSDPWLFAILLMISLALTGCGQTQSNSSQADVPSSANIGAAASVQIVHKVYSETFRDQEGNVLVEAQMIYPEISNPNNEQGIAMINAYYEQQLGYFQNTIKTQELINATQFKEWAKQKGFSFRPYKFSRDFQIDYNANNLLSILDQEFVDRGGAHPNTSWTSETFAVKQGKKLALNDILGGTKEEALEKVYSTAWAEIQKSEGTDQFFHMPIFKDDVRTTYSAKDFVLTENSIMFYYQLYSIAPYASGFPKFEIPYSSQSQFAMSIPVVPSQKAEREVYQQATWLLNRNKTVYFEIYGLSMLKLQTPEGGFGKETLFPVSDERFRTFADLESYLKRTYVQAEANALLNNGRYLDKDGKLYGDRSKDSSAGYDVDWKNYSFVITDLGVNSAVLNVYSMDNSPAGKEKKVTLTTPLIKENDSWQFTKMLH